MFVNSQQNSDDMPCISFVCQFCSIFSGVTALSVAKKCKTDYVLLFWSVLGVDMDVTLYEALSFPLLDYNTNFVYIFCSNKVF